MNLFLRIFYAFAKVLTRTMLTVFYQNRTFLHPKHLDFKQPTILISNHPNTMVDPLTAASAPKKQVFFLGNASLFGNAFSHWFFSTFYVIPIMRPGDKSYKTVSNADSFQKCYEHLAKGGAIYIAPEGGSFIGRQIRPFKTGTARIALEAEKINDFQLNLQILPIGLVYDYPEQFGSQQLINVGQPIIVKDYQEKYLSAPVETFKQLTSELEDTIKDLTLHYDTEEENQFNYQYTNLLRTENISEADIFKQLKTIKKELPPEKKSAIYASLDQYSQKLEQSKTTDKALYQNQQQNLWLVPKYILGIVLGFPFFLLGGINNFFVYFLPYWVAKKIKIYPGYLATIKLLTGLIIVPIFYTIQYQLVKHYLGNPTALIYLLLLLPMGIFAWRYTRFAKQAKYFFNNMSIAEQKKQELWELRNKIKKLLS